MIEEINDIIRLLPKPEAPYHNAYIETLYKTFKIKSVLKIDESNLEFFDYTE